MEQGPLLPSLLLFRLPQDSPLRAVAQAEDWEALYGGFQQVISLASKWGVSGNIWQLCLCWELIRNENPWSLACESAGDPGGTLSRLAQEDLTNLKDLFFERFSWLDPSLQRALLQFDPGDRQATPAGTLAAQLRDALAQSRNPQEAQELLARFYQRQGLGEFALSRAFRLDNGGSLVPVQSVKRTSLHDLVGYDAQKAQLAENTLAFLTGKPSNNVLLYGDAGTGKSTSIRSLLTDFSSTSLRLVELSTAQLALLAPLMASLRERRYRFILFIDDLSFEEHETGYKHLKAVIEGGLETMPDNVRIYATSNRRHLIKETWKDKADMEHDGDIHRSDTVEEKLSLASRFGVAINFPSPVRKEYHQIVLSLAKKQLSSFEEERLLLEADRWEIRHGGISGRTAQQFIDYKAGLEQA